MLKELLSLNRPRKRPIEVILPDGRIVVVDDRKYIQLLKAGIITRDYPARRVDI